MKETGIVRRIDDLGRVVIPKEIRRNLRIREGDPLEIFIDKDGEIILKKYSPIGELSDFAKEYAQAISESLGEVACIADRDSVIAVSGASKKDFLGRPLGAMVVKAMEDRRVFVNNYYETHGTSKPGSIIADENADPVFRFAGEVIAPIIAQGDPIGAVIIGVKEGRISLDVDQKVAETAAVFLSRQIEQ